MDLREIDRRLDSLAKTPEGFLNGEGMATAALAVINARNAFRLIGTSGYEALAPTVSGGILYDYHTDKGGKGIEFFAGGHIFLFGETREDDGSLLDLEDFYPDFDAFSRDAPRILAL